MGKSHAPRRGTLQFWPHRRAKSETARIRYWAPLKETKPLAFLGYKAGMCHVIAIDNRPKVLTKGEEVGIPVTILECPPMKVVAINFYRLMPVGQQMISTIRAPSWDKEMERVLQMQKKPSKNISDVVFDDLRLVIATQPKLTGIGTKKPKLAEVALSGSKEEKLKFAQERLGKEITVSDVFKEGNLVDIHAISKGKGFQGPVKRHGVMLRHHKSEKARRANVRGPWTGPKMWTVPHSGKTGEIQSPGGLPQYGQVKNSYLLIYGSLQGPRKGIVTLTQPIRLTTIPF